MRTGARFVLVIALVLPIFAACGSQRAEPIGSSGQTLLAQGQYCTAASECSTGFCVDAVCCDTACGGTTAMPCGVGDQYSCSNIYGQVAGLVDGTCTLLQVGQACGVLGSTCDPCQARGSLLNTGNNCPNPQLFSRNGLVCRSAQGPCDPEAICTNSTCPPDINICGDSGTDASGDGSSSDGSVSDGSASDGSASDGSASDGSASDGSASDGSASDGAASDGSVGDGGATDGGATDGSATDGSATDGSTSDAGGGDAGTSDAGTSDAGGGDAGKSDAGSGDAGKSDAGGPCVHDSDCPSGLLCATSGPNKGKCVECMSDQQCGATETCDLATGTCVNDNGTLEGGGCSCTTSGSSASPWPIVLAAGVLAGLLSRRRHKR